jgi:hypothetical protein
MKTAFLLLLISQVTACTNKAQPIRPWGEVTDGLQLSVTTGINTVTLTETQSLLYLNVQMRNVSNAPLSVDFDNATYDFEYEIDSTWYAFERMDPLGYAAAYPILSTIPPGLQRWTMLTVPLAGRSRALQLFEVTAGGLGRRFEPKPGAHVIRVRPARALVDTTRQAPVSNAVAVSLQIPVPIDTRAQSVSFPPSRDTSLRGLQFVSGPRDAQAAIRRVLARPQFPASAPLIITSAALEVLEPIPMYELRLTPRSAAPNPSLPTLSNRYLYLVRAADQVVGFISLDAYPTVFTPAMGYPGPDPFPPGAVYNSSFTAAANADAVFRSLQQLAQMEQVRGGNYEPRSVQVYGVRGASPVSVLWLHSKSGRPDLFYRERDPDYRGWTQVEAGKLYTTEEFLTAARALPVPRYNEAWAIRIASGCARAEWPMSRHPLIYDQAVAEIGVSAEGTQSISRIVWYVYFPERQEERTKHAGARFLVDETDGTCRMLVQG